MKEFAKKAISRISRLAAREIRLVGQGGDSFNLTDVAFLMAAMDSARFVEENMPSAKILPSDLALLTNAVESAPRDGLILEFGVASGRTIRHIASVTDRMIHGFDSFDGLPETWRPGYEKGAFAQALPAVPDQVILHKGLFSDTLPQFLSVYPEPVALLHVDCDLYSSTACVLGLLKDRIRAGTVIVFDEYFNYPGWKNHEHKAFAEFIKDTGLTFNFNSFVASHQQVCVTIG